MIGVVFCTQLFGNLLLSEAYTKVAEYNDGTTVAVSGTKSDGEDRLFTSYLASSDVTVNRIANAKEYELSKEVKCSIGTRVVPVWVLVRRVRERI